MFIIHKDKITGEFERLFVQTKIITSRFEDSITDEVNKFLNETNGIMIQQVLTANTLSKHQERYTMHITYGQHYHNCGCKICKTVGPFA